MALIRFPSIRAKLLALFLVGGVLPIALVSLISYFNSLKAVEEMVGNRTDRLARSVGEDLSVKLDRHLSDRMLVENQPLQDFLGGVAAGEFLDQPRAYGDLHRYLTGLFEEYGDYYNGMIVADAAGTPVFRFDPHEGAVGFPPATSAEIPATQAVPAVRPAAPEAPTGTGGEDGSARADSADDGVETAELQSEMERSRLRRENLARRIESWTRGIQQMSGAQIEFSLGEGDTVEIDGESVEISDEVTDLISSALKAAADIGLTFDGPEFPPEPAAGPPRQVPVGTFTPAGFTERDRAAAKQGTKLGRSEVLVFTDRAVTGGPRLLRVLMPVFAVEDSGRRLGTLLANLRLDYLFPQDLMAERFGVNGELLVVNTTTGEILFHTQGDLEGRDIRLADYRLVDAFRAIRGRDPEEPTWVDAPGEKGNRLAAVADVGVLPWRVVATALPREFETEARRAGVVNLLVAVLAVLMAGTILLLASGRISRSIKVVTLGAREISAGNLGHSIEVTTHDEIQTLGETFNVMTASLRENIALRERAAEELEALNRTLEDRVQERTQELETLNAALNAANQELKELDRLKSHFLSTVSHEFRTPLTSIKAFSEILLDEADSRNASAEMKRFLGIINSESDRLSRLIRNLLNLSRLESGRMTWKLSVFPVADVVDAAVDALMPAFAQKNVQLMRESVCPGTRFRADRDRIHEVVTNLVENAIKFSDSGQKIWIRCGKDEPGTDGRRFLRISVQDEGPGIPPDHLEKIFERFSQADNSDTRAKGGSGLGLAICKEIVEYHGGRIWAESPPGEGATFHFSLPMVAEGEDPGDHGESIETSRPRVSEEKRHV